jgi:hypothetical protein
MTAFKRSLGAALAASVLCLPAAADDLTIVSKVGGGKNAPTTTTSYYASDRMRVVNPDGQEFMAEFASGNITMIDNKKRQYSVVTPQEIEAASAKMQAQMKQMEEQMKSLPQAVRDKMGLGGLAQAVNVQKGEGGREIAGYSCDNWVVTMGEMMKQEQCLTTELQYPAPAWDAYKNFAASMSAAAGPMGKGMQQMYEKFKDMKGVPLASTSTVKVLGKSSTSSTEVSEVKKGAIPASAWEIPAGFKKVDSPMAKMLK